ncbi:hypothetical protein [Enterobacter ludwigii]|uniref:hypothetical protein n=1 Tax=Enterobacter ludwigii TaxID=299767 RepID=UPI0018685994|nr:hypothetical protein [Enterobacter ludwigii]
MRQFGGEMSGNKTQPDNHFSLWTVKDLTFLENNYRTMAVAELATILKRSQGAVGLMANLIPEEAKNMLTLEAYAGG